MRKMILITAVVMARMAGPALAESFNIDYGANAATKPANAYGAAPPQVGFWNAVPNIALFAPLQNLAGAATPVSIVGSGGVAGGCADAATPVGGPTRLMDDDIRFGAGAVTFTVQNIQAGAYWVYVYAWGPCAPADISSVRLRDFGFVPGAWSAWTNCGGWWPAGGAWVSGTNYVCHQVNVTPVAGGRGNFQIQLAVAGGALGHLNGIQITPVGLGPGPNPNPDG